MSASWRFPSTVAVLLGLLPLSAPFPLAAQDLPLGAADAGKVVRARLVGDGTVQGRFVPLGDGRLGIRTDQGATDTLRLGSLSELAVRQRHTRTGAIVGGIAGVGFGVFVGYVANALCDAADCRTGRTYAIAIPVFGAGGALLGAALGSAFPKWKRVFP